MNLAVQRAADEARDLINPKAVGALGLTIPPPLLQRADEAIQQ